VGEALDRIMELDYRASLRQEVAIWDLRRGPGFPPASDELVERIAERLPASTWRALSSALAREADAAGDMEPILREIDVPLLLAEHRGCVSYTEEGFADIAKAFPDAQTVSCSTRPTLSEEFTAALREFSTRVW
jgi:hypothetical protein